MKKITFRSWTIPLALLLICLISFGPMLPRLGFYWDDWPSIWFLHFFGPAVFRDSFAIDRPLLAWVFMLTTSVIGESPLAWQVFGLFTRWLSCVVLWWTLRQLWPRQPVQVAWIALLFAVYPGFRQGYISVTYSNVFLVLSIFLFSFGSMLLALRKRRWFWPLMALSVSSSALSAFISEYFIGLELLRPVILWLALKDSVSSKSQRLKKTLLLWSPYLLILVVFLIWRIFFHESPRGRLIIFDQLSAAPIQSLLSLGKTILLDLAEVFALAWAKTVYLPRLSGFSWLPILAYALVVIFAAALTIFYLSRLRDETQLDPSQARKIDKSWARQDILLGLFTLFIAGWPVWVTNLHIELQFAWDRFTLPMMLGASMLLAGLVGLVCRTRRQGAVLIGVAIGLAAGMHFYDGVIFRQEWLAQQAFFWQLAWRAPEIQPGTTLLTSALPFTYYSDNSLTAPLDWTYAPEDSSRQLPYVLMDIEARLGTQFPGFEPGLEINQPYRAASFKGSTSQAVVLFYEPPRCLKVMHPQFDLNLPYKPLYIPEALLLSNPGLIHDDFQQPARPPAPFFGTEPARDWCYYFEKAELASLNEDWPRVVELGEQALKLGKTFTRETASELVPFIRGYAYTGDWEKALDLSLEAYRASEKMQNMLCAHWFFIQGSTLPSAAREAALDQIRDQIQCNLP
jgi:hypothetical protein